MSAASDAQSEAPWNAAQIAQDLIAQVEELLDESLPAAAVMRALETEGLSSDTAQALVLQAKGRSDGPKDDDTIVCGIEISQMRRFLRRPGPSLMPDGEAMTELREAFVQQGIPAALAASIVAEIAAGQGRLGDVFARRLRLVALQGMIAGAIFTLFFAWTTLATWPSGRWHLITLAATSGLTIYSALLYRSRRASVEPRDDQA